VSVLRAAARVATVDVAAAEKGALAADQPPAPVLQAGDVVVVPTRELRTVAVLGSVQAPGLLEVEDEIAVLAAVTRAQGTTEDADLANATLTRSDGTVEKVELEKLYREGELARNVLLRPGDSLFVPFRRGRVTIAGVVREPGNFPALTPLTYAEALAAAGGGGEHADLSHVVHTGEDGTSRKVDVEALLASPSRESSRLVHPGDTLYIPELRSVVSVVGRVEKPGSYLLLPGQRVLSVIPQAGRILEDADPAAATLTRRDGVVVPLALDALLEKGNVEANVVLQPDDVITIPRYSRRLFVFGEVHAPGSYRLAPEDGILDAIDRAGGLEKDPDLGRSFVVRQRPEVIKVDLGARVTRGDLSQEVGLQDGDILFIPRHRDRLQARDVIDYLFGLDLIRRVLRKD